MSYNSIINTFPLLLYYLPTPQGLFFFFKNQEWVLDFVKCFSYVYCDNDRIFLFPLLMLWAVMIDFKILNKYLLTNILFVLTCTHMRYYQPKVFDE